MNNTEHLSLNEYVNHKVFLLRENHYEIILASIFIHILALTVPISISLFFDLVLPNQSMMTAVTLFVAVLMAAIFDACLRYARTLLVERTAKKVDAQSELKVDKIVFDNYRYISNQGDAISSIKNLKRHVLDITALERSTFIIPTLDIACSFIYILAIYFIAGSIVLIPLSFVIAIMSVGIFLSLRNSVIEKNYLQLMSEKNIHEVEMMGNIDQVILNRWSDHTQDEIEKVEHINQYVSRSRSCGQMFSMFVNGATQLQTISILLAGFFAITLQSISAGALFATLMLSGRLMSSMGGIYNVHTCILKYKKAIDAVSDYEKNISHRKSNFSSQSLTHLDEIIELKNICLDYDDKPALVDINLKFDVNEKIAIIGENGSGKSSLLKLLIGILIPSKGSIFYSGIPHNHIAHQSLLKKINLLLQHPVLFKGTVGSNLGVGTNGMSYEEVMAKLSSFKMCDFITKSGLGLNMPVETNGENICVGHRQIISIMRCILSDSELILLDEPTMGLQQNDCEELIDWISNTNKGVIVTSHDKRLIDAMKRVIQLKNGTCIADRPVRLKSHTRSVKVSELKKIRKDGHE